MSGSQPLFSIVTVCRNSASLIDGTIDSLKRQSYSDYEYVVIDGASTDSTYELIGRNTQDLPIRAISEPDAGIYDAMNKAISIAKGQWVFFLNAGDEFVDGSVLANVANAISSSSECDLVYGDVILRSQDGATLLRFDWLRDWNMRFEFLCHQAVFVRTELFRQIGGFDLTYKVAADYDWLLRVMKHGGATRYVGFPICFFDMHGLSQRSRERIRTENASIRRKLFPGPGNRGAEFLYRLASKSLRAIGVWRR